MLNVKLKCNFNIFLGEHCSIYLILLLFKSFCILKNQNLLKNHEKF